MEVKGTAVKSIKDFVEKNYKDQYNNWLKSLPESTQTVFRGGIFANNWYHINDGAIEPTKAIAKMFFNNDSKEAAFQSGRFSAKIGLTGVYKIFIMIAKPSYIIQRASRVFQSYYRPSNMTVLNPTNTGVTLHMTDFPEPNSIIDYRIAGWIQQALELTHCRNVKVTVTKSLAKGDDVTEFTITWE